MTVAMTRFTSFMYIRLFVHMGTLLGEYSMGFGQVVVAVGVVARREAAVRRSGRIRIGV